MSLRRVHHDTLQPYVRSRLESGTSPGTINRDLAVVRRILNLSARLWRDESDRPWLDTPPLIQMQHHPNKREPYPLSVEEQRVLFSELAGHLARMALFKVNTGLWEQEVVNLRWLWELPVPDLDTSVFVVPRAFVKNGLDRFVVLNRVAKSVIDGCRGEHPEFVFTRRGNPSRGFITRDGRPRVVVPRSATQASSADPVRRDSDPFGYMILSTRTVTGYAPPALGSRIANCFGSQRPVTSPRTIRHRKLAL